MASLELPTNEMNEFDLPRVCIVTGQTEGVVFKDVKFSWHPRWVSLFIIINILLAAILAYALTKKVQGQLPFTEEAWARWKRGQQLFGLACGLAVMMLIGALVLIGRDNQELGLVLLLAFIALPITARIALLRNKAPVVERIADGRITLKIPSQAAADALQRHLVGGAARAPGTRQAA